MEKSYITASEISEFVFCKRGWWLKKQALLETTDAMTAGTKAHNSLTTLLYQHKSKVVGAFILLGIGVFGLVVTSFMQLFF